MDRRFSSQSFRWSYTREDDDWKQKLFPGRLSRYGFTILANQGRWCRDWPFTYLSKQKKCRMLWGMESFWSGISFEVHQASTLLSYSAMRNSLCLCPKGDCKAGIIVTSQERNFRKFSISCLIWNRFILYLFCRLSVIELIDSRTVGRR